GVEEQVRHVELDELLVRVQHELFQAEQRLDLAGDKRVGRRVGGGAGRAVRRATLAGPARPEVVGDPGLEHAHRVVQRDAAADRRQAGQVVDAVGALVADIGELKAAADAQLEGDPRLVFPGDVPGVGGAADDETLAALKPGLHAGRHAGPGVLAQVVADDALD